MQSKPYRLQPPIHICFWSAVLLLGLLLHTTPLWAHKVNVFAWVEGDDVHMQSWFSGGKKPKDAPVAVYDLKDNLLLAGQTDHQGEFSFPIPKKCALKIVLTAGMGHRGEWIIPAQDIPEADPTTPAGGSPPLSNPDQTSATLKAKADSTAQSVTQEEIAGTLELVLDKKLKPIINMMAEERRQSPSARDILGGIGYIIGLVGLAAYIQARKIKRQD
jgi:nickel transport protein